MRLSAPVDFSPTGWGIELSTILRVNMKIRSWVATLSVIAAGIILVPGCTPDAAKQLEFGKAVPDARYEVILDREYSVVQLAPQLERLASAVGFENDKDEGNEQRLKPHFRILRIPGRTWNPKDRRDLPEYGLGLATPRGLSNTDKFEVIYYHIDTEPFDAGDWAVFAEWGEYSIPSFFPDSEIRVTKHPARQTTREEIERISTETTLAVPEEFQSKTSIVEE